MSLADRYAPLRLHPELFEQAWDGQLHAPLLHALRQPNATAVRQLLRQVTPGVFSFELFSPSLCDRIAEELEHYAASGLPAERPNSMNNYGLILNSIGLRPAMDRLQRSVFQPLAELLYPSHAHRGFTGHHSFTVRYKADEDLGLDVHTDDSDVTVNVCLGREFSGARLTICGDSRTPTHRQFFAAYEHVRGRARSHLGSRRRGADAMAAGERLNVIVWNQNAHHRASADYVNKRPYLAEVAPPDPRCLSYTHDRDYGQFKDYPAGREDFTARGWCPPAFACYDSMDPVLAHDEL